MDVKQDGIYVSIFSQLFFRQIMSYCNKRNVKTISLLLITIITTFPYASLVKRIDTLNNGQDLNVIKGTSGNPNTLRDFSVYTCADTIPDIDLFFARYSYLAKTKATPLCRIGGGYWGIGSPRRFYMPGYVPQPGSLGEPGNPPPSVDSLHFSSPILLVDSTYPAGGTFDEEHVWGMIDTCRDLSYGCTLPCFIHFSYINSTINYHNVMIVKTKGGKFVLIKTVPVIDTIPSQDPPGGWCYWFKSLIVTSYLQTDGSTDFTGITEINNTRKTPTYSRPALAKSGFGLYDIQGRMVRIAGFRKVDNRILLNESGRIIEVFR